MVDKNLNKIFLSASIPLPERNPLFVGTADIVAIRDSVRALATVVIPKAHLIWGGHPSITPLIRFVLNTMNTSSKEHVTLYQSLFFEDRFPEDNFAFENIILTDKKDNITESIQEMRLEMIVGNEFKAGIFVGGMEGINDEYNLFKKNHPDALVLPVASTGAAAKILFNNIQPKPNVRLENDYAYMSLFRDLLKEYIN